jgi:hypothetical protein
MLFFKYVLDSVCVFLLTCFVSNMTFYGFIEC